MPHDSKITGVDYQSFPGQVFGRLTVISCLDGAPKGKSKWLCQCECGGTATPLRHHLIAGNVKSCGCIRSELAIRNGLASTKHGMHRTKEYWAWRSMLSRCYYVANASSSRYSERGIKVCDRWRNSFENFLEDMGTVPPGGSLDRIDNDKDYGPDNCQWGTPKTQARNRSSNHLVTYQGQTATLAEWSEKTGVPYETLRHRFLRNWTVEQAFTRPVRTPSNRRSKQGPLTGGQS